MATCRSMMAKTMSAKSVTVTINVNDGHNIDYGTRHIMSMTVIYLAVVIYVVAVIDVAVIVCGRHGLAVMVYLVAVMDILCGRRRGLWPSLIWPSWFVAVMV